MNQVKPWYQSKTIIAGVVAFLAGLAGIFGYTIAETDQVTITEAVISIVTAVSGLVAIYGRKKATAEIQ